MSSSANPSVPPPPAAPIVFPPPSPAVVLAPSAASSGHSTAFLQRPSRITKLMIPLGLAMLMTVVLGLLWYMRRNRQQPSPRVERRVDLPQRQRRQPPAPRPRDQRGSNVPNRSLPGRAIRFKPEELSRATNGFSHANFLGEGGFGSVYKGNADGRVVAIKQRKDTSKQGEPEFQAEIGTIGCIHHRHLVSLVGYCISGDQKTLVYEFVPNKSLEFHLYAKDRPPLSWENRMRVALGAARGLVYLHEECQPKIIHRDIKAANILLDQNFEAKVADFGLARLILDTETYVSTLPAGTFGYLDPEYFTTQKLTEKTDIFSFGVVLLELITGRKPNTDPVNDANMVLWAKPLLIKALKDNNFSQLADPRLKEDYNLAEMKRMVYCAAGCVYRSAPHRPRMSQVARALEGDVSMDDLNKGFGPPYDNPYYNTSQNKEDLEKLRKLALQTSSEYRASTSKHGLQPSGSRS